MKTREERKRVMLFVLPVVLLALLALAFYALGGGRTEQGKAAALAGRGLNAELPGAKFKQEKPEDKLGLYEKAQLDSMGRGKAFGAGGALAALSWDTAGFRKKALNGSGSRSVGIGGSVAGNSSSIRDNEMKIRQKLAEIDEAVNTPVVQPGLVKGPASGVDHSGSDLELARLEKMLRQQQVDRPVPDPELERLNGMLDKIVAIQHPGGRHVPDSVKKRVGVASNDTAFKAVSAVVDGNQRVLQGGLVRLKLRDSLVLDGLCFHAGQLLFGSCTIANQRLLLEIRNVRLGHAIVPVNLTVFSLDGMAGINAPEAELGEAAGQGTANALDNMQFLSMDESVGTQAAAAGITAAKGLIGKKARRVKVHLKDGYPVLLRNNEVRR